MSDTFSSKPHWRMHWQANDIRALRLALGISIAMVLSQSMAWPLAFIAPILTTSFMNSRAPCPGLKQGLSLLIVIIIACFAGLTISWLFIDYPILCLTIIGVALMNIFYLNTGGFSPFLVVLLLVCVTLLPLMAQQSQGLALLVAFGLLIGAIVALLVNWLLHAIFPDHDISAQQIENADPLETNAQKPIDARVKTTLTSMFVVLPIVFLVYILEMSNAALIMIFTVIFAQNPDLQSGYKACIALIIGNCMGGLAAAIIFSLMMFVPSLVFLWLVTFVTSVICAQHIFSDKKHAPLAAMALSTIVLLVGSALLSGDASAGEKFITRILQILGLTLYIVGAFSLASLDWKALLSRFEIKQKI